MKYDEFAFFNQQLAAMLRDGIPLEGALNRLCAEMRRGKLRDELKALETDLASGTPMAPALQKRQLPELYKRMILVGVKSNNLPGALTMLADYFQTQNNLWARLKGLMVYPLIVLLSAFLISCFLAFLFQGFIWKSLQSLTGFQPLSTVSAGMWMSPVLLGLAFATVLIGVSLSPARQKLRWRLPAFWEASVARVASALGLMLQNGVPLDEALALVEQFEKGTIAEKEICQWRQRLASGHKTFSELTTATSSNSVFPPLFVWTVAQAGEDLTSGFQRAAELYQGRANYKTEVILYSARPCSISLLAFMLISQISPVFAALTTIIKNLSGGVGD